MTFLMHVITTLELTNADMVNAIGSIVTRSLKFAWPVGMVLHLSAGIAFAMSALVISNAVITCMRKVIPPVATTPAATEVNKRSL